MRTGFFSLLACCFLVGCGSSTGSRTAEEEHLRKLGTYYSRYLAQHKGMPPATVDDLKAFMKKEGVPAEGFDALFVSPRDGEAYVVHLKKRLGPPRADGPIVRPQAEESRLARRALRLSWLRTPASASWVSAAAKASSPSRGGK